MTLITSTPNSIPFKDHSYLISYSIILEHIVSQINELKENGHKPVAIVCSEKIYENVSDPLVNYGKDNVLSPKTEVTLYGLPIYIIPELSDKSVRVLAENQLETEQEAAIRLL